MTIETETCLALIPARKGSKRLPDKNRRELAGKSLLAWTLDSALESHCFDHILVSTDDALLRQFALDYGVQAPFLRPAELATDTATTVDVVQHALRFQQERGINYHWICLLQPTSPFRNSLDISHAFAMAHEKNASAIVSVSPCEHSPLWANTLPDDMRMDSFLPTELINRRSQDLPTYYRLNGAIYLCRTDAFWTYGSLIPPSGCFALTMPPERSIDIDTQLDFDIAQVLAVKTDSLQNTQH